MTAEYRAELASIRDTPDPELFEYLLTLSEEASGAKAKTVDSLIDLKAKLLTGVDGLDAALTARAHEEKILGGLRHTVASRVSRYRAEKHLRAAGVEIGPAHPLAPGAPAPARTLSVLFLVGLASIGVAAGYPRAEVSPVTATVHPSPSAAIIAGKAAMLRGDYSEAIQHFHDAKAADAAPGSYLPDVIECYVTTQQYGLAAMYVAELERSNPRNQSLVPYYRGCIEYGLGHRDAAKRLLAEAKGLGHPMADVVLRGMGGS